MNASLHQQLARRKRRIARRLEHRPGVERHQPMLAAANIRYEVAEKVRSRAGAAETSILEAYVLMATDSTLREEVERHVRLDRQCVEWALDTAMYEMSAQLRDAEDPYLVERSHDFEFIRDRIMRALTGRGRAVVVPEGPEPVVLVAHDLSPAETATRAQTRAASRTARGSTDQLDSNTRSRSGMSA